MYKERLDNELIYLIEENDEDALNELIDRYNVKIYSTINKYKTKAKNLGLDISDLYQEGLFGLINSIKTYDQDKEASFKTYASIVIERQILDLVKAHDRVKYKTLNNAISLDNFTLEEEQSLYNFIEIDTNTPEVKLIDQEIKENLKKILTEFELKVYELKIEGKTNKEISFILNKPSRSIENTLQRIKLKLKNNLEDNI